MGHTIIYARRQILPSDFWLPSVLAYSIKDDERRENQRVKMGAGVKQARLDILSTLLSAADGSSVDARLQGCMAFDDKVNGRWGQGKGGPAVGGGFAEWEVTVLYKAWDDAGLDCVTAPWSMEERPPSTERERRRREWEFCHPPITDARLHSVSQNPMGRRQEVATARIILTQQPRYQPFVPVSFPPVGRCKRFRIQTSGFTGSGLPKGVWGGCESEAPVFACQCWVLLRRRPSIKRLTEAARRIASTTHWGPAGAQLFECNSSNQHLFKVLKWTQSGLESARILSMGTCETRKAAKIKNKKHLICACKRPGN